MERYNYSRQGKLTVFCLLLFMLFVVGVYICARTIWPPEETAYAAMDFVEVNRFGEVSIKSAEDIEWFIGKEKALPLEAGFKNRNAQIADLRGRVRTLFAELNQRAGLVLAPEINEVLSAMERGEAITLPRPLPVRDPSSWRQKARAWLEDKSPYDPAAGERNRLKGLTELSKALKESNQQLQNLDATEAYYSEIRSGTVNELKAQLNSIRSTLKQTNAPSSEVSAALDLMQDRIGFLEDPYNRERKPEIMLVNTPVNPPRDTLVELIPAFRSTVRRLDSALEGFDAGDAIRSPAGTIFAALIRRHQEALSSTVGTALQTEIASTLAQLDSLREEQLSSIRSMRQPEKFNLFWNTSRGMVWEIVFWALFGVTTNLLLHVAEATRKKEFNRSEGVVIISKIAYAPAVAVVISLGILTGMVDLMGESVRVWSIPLLAFLLGFNARKAAGLVDRLGEKVLSRLEGSFDKNAAERLAARRANIAAIEDALPPTSLNDLKQQARERADGILRNVITNLENRR
jgi:hypothetical protein